MENPTTQQPITPATRANEVVEKYDPHANERKKRGSCLGIMGVILGVLFIGGAWVVAATGLVTVPVISSLAYRPVQPMHQVKAGVSVAQTVQSTLPTLITKKYQATGGRQTVFDVSIQIPESALTRTIQDGLEKNAIEIIDTKGTQIAVGEGQMLELYVPIKRNGNTTPLLVTMHLVQDQGVFDLSIDHAVLGSMPLPAMWIGALTESAVTEQLTYLNKAISTYMSVHTLETKDAALVITGEVHLQTK